VAGNFPVEFANSMPLRSIAIVVSFLLITTSELRSAELKVPEGFTLQQAAHDPQIRFPMFGALDEQGRLFVAESSGLDLYDELQKLTRKCRISRLTDSDADGRYDKADVFATNLVFPMGLVWRANKLYVADPPDLITLEDTDNDGRADKRTVLLTGFGHTDNGSLHGLTFGPDAWLYMTMGQPDGYRLKRADGSMLEGNSGALLRCRPNGSEVEVVARGFENLVEVVFLPAGEIIGTDNWFFLPQDGVRDALVHVLEGGLYPLDAHAKTERSLFQSGISLPPVAVYPAVALSGLVRYTGQTFPASMRDNLFSAQFNTRKIARHNLTRSGATFTSSDEDFVSTDDPDFHPSDVLQDHDGSLLVIDTGSWYVQHCPTGRIRKAPSIGGIYRVFHKGTGPQPRPQNPLTPEHLLDSELHFQAKEDLVWRLSREHPADLVTRLPKMDTHPELQALTIRALARVKEKLASSLLASLLTSPHAVVRVATAEALPHCADHAIVPLILQSLATNPAPFLQHALVFALSRLATPAHLQSALDHPAAAVRRAAIVLLDQPPPKNLRVEPVLKAIESTDDALRAAGLASIANHPEWTDSVIALAHKTLSAPSAVHRIETLRAIVSAFPRDTSLETALSSAIQQQTRSPRDRIDLLQTLRLASHANSEPLRVAIQALLGTDVDELVNEAIGVITSKQLPGFEDSLKQIASAAKNPPALRLAALRASVRPGADLPLATSTFLQSQLSSTNTPALKLAAFEILSNASLSTAGLHALIKTAASDPLISADRVLAAAQRAKLNRESSHELAGYLRKQMSSGWQPSAKTVEWLTKDLEPHIPDFTSYLNEQARTFTTRQRDLLASYQPLLDGGDPNNGQSLFLAKAACATCHRIGKTGGLIGPDLTKIGAIRSNHDLLESIVLPSATLAQGYESYEITLKNADVLTGNRVRELTDTFVIREATGNELRLSQENIAKIETRSTSLMPEGLLTALTREEIRDLMAFLRSLR
jgi:putative membrane-bound dehydrogenase-like protein